MKLIIDIPEEIYKDIMAHNREMRESGKSAYYFEGLIQNATPIPDNATNGDVLKIIFPKIGVYDEWYDEPYQKGSK